MSEKPPPPPRDDLAGADAGRADPRGAVLVAGARTRLAGRLAGHPQRDRGPVDRLGEAERHLGLDVLAAARLRARTRAAAAVEQAAEDVAETAAEAAAAGPPARRPGPPPKRSPRSKLKLPPARAGTGPEAAVAEEGARLVVLLALLGVAEDVVGLGDLLEALLGLGVALVGVRVELAGELPVRLLDLGVGGVLGDAEDLVVVLLDEVLACSSSTSLLPSRRAAEPRRPWPVDVSPPRGHRSPRRRSVSSFAAAWGCAPGWGSATATRAGRMVRSPMRYPGCRIATQVVSVTSGAYECISASWTVGSKGSPSLPNCCRPILAATVSSDSADRLEAADQLAVFPGAADVVEHGQELGQEVRDGDLLDRDPVPLDPAAVVLVLGLEPLEVRRALVERGADLVQLGRRGRLCCDCVPGRGRRPSSVERGRRPSARRPSGVAPEGTSGFSSKPGVSSVTRHRPWRLARRPRSRRRRRRHRPGGVRPRRLRRHPAAPRLGLGVGVHAPGPASARRPRPSRWRCGSRRCPRP